MVKDNMNFKPVLVAAVLAGSAVSGSAQAESAYTFTFTGKISQGGDEWGLTGSPVADLTGQAYTLTVTATDNPAHYNQVIAGAGNYVRMSDPSDDYNRFSVTATIAGKTVSLDSVRPLEMTQTFSTSYANSSPNISTWDYGLATADPGYGKNHGYTNALPWVDLFGFVQSGVSSPGYVPAATFNQNISGNVNTPGSALNGQISFNFGYTKQSFDPNMYINQSQGVLYFAGSVESFSISPANLSLTPAAPSPVSSVPEPAPVAMYGCAFALLGLSVLRRKRSR